jgi:putative ABC transport system permease protein
VLALVLRQGSIPIAAGLVVGLTSAFALTRLLKSLLYEISATDPLIFGAVSLGLGAGSYVRAGAQGISHRSTRSAAV